MPAFIDLMGKQFGRLTVIKRNGVSKDGHILWSCRCICNKKINVNGNSLKSGHTKSCGCLRKETSSINSKIYSTTHGHRHTSIYNIWIGMIQRCNNPKNNSYRYYGGRGIFVCKRWMKFEHFLEDVGERPKGKTLGRINNNMGYKKSNCKWSTPKEQSRNKRNTKFYYYNNKKQDLLTLAEKYNIKPATLRERISRGLSIEKALTTPVRKRRHK